MNSDEHEPASESTQEREPIEPATIERTASRFQARIIEGITSATEAGTEIDARTARTIAHILGRAFGSQSALAEFGRTGEGVYHSLREEYLALYVDESIPPVVKEWIDWFGTYLVQRDGTGSGRQFMGADRTPDLDRLLVRATVSVDGVPHVVHAPATVNGSGITCLGEQLSNSPEARTAAFWAFLSFPDVNAADPNLVESFQDSFIEEFRTIEDALYGLTELTDWEADLRTFAEDRGLLPDAVSIDHDVIENQTRDVYDLVEIGGSIYAFNR